MALEIFHSIIALDRQNCLSNLIVGSVLHHCHCLISSLLSPLVGKDLRLSAFRFPFAPLDHKTYLCPSPSGRVIIYIIYMSTCHIV